MEPVLKTDATTALLNIHVNEANSQVTQQMQRAVLSKSVRKETSKGTNRLRKDQRVVGYQQASHETLLHHSSLLFGGFAVQIFEYFTL